MIFGPMADERKLSGSPSIKKIIILVANTISYDGAAVVQCIIMILLLFHFEF